MATRSLKMPAKRTATLNGGSEHRKLRKSDPARVPLQQSAKSKHRKKHIVSALERAGDLVGSVIGPADLSTNSKYLQDYGK